MAWAVLCRDRDDIDTAALRLKHHQGHFACVESILDRLLIAGSPALAAAGRRHLD
jgi:hypothetical protein